MSADQGHGLTIGQAADVLGISENAVRQRIKRGSLEAAKVDGIWRVVVGDHEADYQATSRSDYQADYEPTTSQPAINPAALAQLEAIRDQWLQPLVTQIRELERDVGRLAAERDQVTRERDELRETKATQTAGAAFAAPHPDDAGESIAVTAANAAAVRRPWWKFWEL
jgi:predicted ArsR family transcriptional regulator